MVFLSGQRQETVGNYGNQGNHKNPFIDNLTEINSRSAQNSDQYVGTDADGTLFPVHLHAFFSFQPHNRADHAADKQTEDGNVGINSHFRIN
jgi:predicted SnoaL-like aldol condensation-catalyzing enzyme